MFFLISFVFIGAAYRRMDFIINPELSAADTAKARGCCFKKASAAEWLPICRSADAR
nr:hypothetical protein [uncultured Prevotella sp.]